MKTTTELLAELREQPMREQRERFTQWFVDYTTPDFVYPSTEAPSPVVSEAPEVDPLTSFELQDQAGAGRGASSLPGFVA